MSITGNSRPRIPYAFMPAGWGKETDSKPEEATKPRTENADIAFSTNLVTDSFQPSIVPSIPSFPFSNSNQSSNTRSKVNSPKDTQDSLNKLKGIKARQIAQNRTRSVLGQQKVSPSEFSYYSHTRSTDDTHHSSKSFTQISFKPSPLNFTKTIPLLITSPSPPHSPNTFVTISNPVEPSESSTFASSRNMHDSWRKFKERNASMRLLRAASQSLNEEDTEEGAVLSHNTFRAKTLNNSIIERLKADEEILRNLAQHHKLAMFQICQAEDKTYESRWTKLQLHDSNKTNASRPHLRFHQIPWPLLTPIIFSPADITLKSVEGFLISPFRKPNLTAKRKLAEEMARWEVGTFEAIVLQRVAEGEKERVREGAERVREILRRLKGKSLK